MVKAVKERVLKIDPVVKLPDGYFKIQSIFQPLAMAEVLAALKKFHMVVYRLVATPAPIKGQPGADYTNMIEQISILDDFDVC